MKQTTKKTHQSIDLRKRSNQLRKYVLKRSVLAQQIVLREYNMFMLTLSVVLVMYIIHQFRLLSKDILTIVHGRVYYINSSWE